jgi:hypothetical protein
MAGFATHADFRKARGKTIVSRIIVLAHAGRVALGAHEIPVLVQLGPMQDVVVFDLLVRIEMEPALAALLLRAAVPGDRERLQPAVREFDEILLQRIDAEGVLHLERGELAVRSVGLGEKFSVLAEEARAHAEMLEAGVVEIAEHRLIGGVLHRVPVLRCAPQLRLRLVAAGTDLAADEGGRAFAGRGAGEPPDHAADGEDRHEHNSSRCKHRHFGEARRRRGRRWRLLP